MGITNNIGKVPGFTDEQTWVLRQIIRDEVSHGISDAIGDSLQKNEEEIDDLKVRVNNLERKHVNSSKFLWVILSSAIATSLLGILDLILHFMKVI
jgi:hypothetical protein